MARDFDLDKVAAQALKTTNVPPEHSQMFQNMEGVQYITVVDERNRRGRPPKNAKKQQAYAQADPNGPSLMTIKLDQEQ